MMLLLPLLLWLLPTRTVVSVSKHSQDVEMSHLDLVSKYCQHLVSQGLRLGLVLVSAIYNSCLRPLTTAAAAAAAAATTTTTTTTTTTIFVFSSTGVFSAIF